MHNKYQTLGYTWSITQGPSTWIHLPSGGRYLGRVRRSCVQGVPWPNFSLMRRAGKKTRRFSVWNMVSNENHENHEKICRPQRQNPRTEYVRSNDVWCDSSGDLDILNMRGHQLWHFSQQCVCVYKYIYIYAQQCDDGELVWMQSGKQIMVYVGARTPILIF